MLRPDLAKEWHPTKNGALGPKNVTPGSKKKVWWLCEQGHWWLASVADRVRGRRCTYCRGLQQQGEQGMADVRPELLREWHPSKNDGIKARQVLCTHKDKLWWLCEKGHEWQATVRTRLAGKLCPYCSSLIPEDFSGARPQGGAASQQASRGGRSPGGLSLRHLSEQQSELHHGQEQRKSKRYDQAATVMIESFQSGIFGYAQMHNYSAGGMLIRADFQLTPGDIVKIRLEKPLFASTSTVLESRVAWCQKFEDEARRHIRFGIGVRLM
ncbi:MAG: zinc-ribbon domain-containing protein [Desulfobacterales bacterium]|nr:zinc-ribbon domain-containing protein [Desulfobacterales bacterium]